jgi:hypothetical protein
VGNGAYFGLITNRNAKETSFPSEFKVRCVGVYNRKKRGVKKRCVVCVRSVLERNVALFVCVILCI